MTVLLTLLLAAFVQTQAPSKVTAIWDASGQAQTWEDPDPATHIIYTFTANGAAIGVIKLLSDGSAATAEPVYWQRAATPALPVSTATISALFTVADAAYLLTGRTDGIPDPTQKFRVVLRWDGWLQRSDSPGSYTATSSPNTISNESLTVSVTTANPIDGTFTIFGGVLPRAPGSPASITFRQMP